MPVYWSLLWCYRSEIGNINQDLSAMPENTSLHGLINFVLMVEFNEVIFKNGFK